MMSLVRNCKFILLLISILAWTGCEKSDPEVSPGDTPDPYVNPGNTPDPGWVITVDNDLMSSMTAIVKVSIASQPGILAAFIGDDCCAVTTLKNYVNGLYYLYISPSEKGQTVQLRFYSPDLKRIFVAKETFLFVNDGRLGTISNPYTPDWTVFSP